MSSQESGGSRADTREQPISAESSEGMVEAIRVSTVFDDPKILEKIAESLLGQGMISGFTIEPVRSGYLHHGKQVSEQQYTLRILLEREGSEGKIAAIKDRFKTAIKDAGWDVPYIHEEAALVSRELLAFIKKAEVEHKRYLGERRKRFAFTLAAFLGFAGVMGTLIDRYADKREQKAVATEQAKSLEKLQGLEQELQRQVALLEAKMEQGDDLTEIPTDMGITPGFEETHALVDLVRQVRETTQRLLAEGGDK